MAAVTQLTPSYLGGVSRQNDDKKILGQVTECINGYPDPTFGLLKRPGMQHVNVLKKANGTAFTKAELDGAVWFFIDRDAAGSYIGAIKGTNIYVWTRADGTFCTVNNTGTSYLTGSNQTDYHFRTVQDVTVITNRTVATQMQAATTFVPNSVGTIRLITLTADLEYSVTIQGIKSEVTPQNSTTFDDFLVYDSSSVNTNHHLIDAIKATIEAQQAANNADFNGVWSLEAYPNSLVIRRTTGTNAVVTDGTQPAGTRVAFTLDAKGGPGNIAIKAYLDSIDDTSTLPVESFNGHHLTILNTASEEDDYYLEYSAYDGVKGKGFWKETIKRGISPGLNAAYMPHQLENTGPTSFNFKPIAWTARQVGDDLTNPPPSFITVNDTTTPPTYTGSKLTSTFFYSDRFGTLSEDNIFLGVANDPFNFFVKSALAQTDSDPIDLNVSSIRPVVLSDVLPSPQGLILFSSRQQFQLYATSTAKLTPRTSEIRSLSNYEMSPDIEPVDVGTSSVFLNTASGYGKLFSLALREIEESPIVIDISKVVLEWIPDTVDILTVSPQNSVIMLVDSQSSYIYLYRYYNNGERDLFQAWVKWELPGTIQTADILNDTLVVVSQHENEYTIGKIILDEIPTGTSVTSATSIDGNSCLDMAARPVSPASGVNPVVYDATNQVTKIYTPYTPISDKKGAMLFGIPTADVGTPAVVDADAGYYLEATERTEIGTGYRYFEVQGNHTAYADGIIIGYNYGFDITLPKFYYRIDENTTDYTAALTISRVHFSVGRTGPIEFKLKSSGSDEWKNIEYVTDANSYAADSSPITSEHQFTIPIHQRNTNFELKVTSNFPYPVSLVSMMWEGNYSPRFYRRT